MTKSFRIKTILLFLAIVLGASLGHAAEIRIRPNAVIRSPIVRLGDVADIVGDPRDVAKLKMLELAVSPVRNGIRTMTLREIRERLILRGVNPIEHRMNGATAVTVRNGGGPYPSTPMAPSSSLASRPRSSATSQQSEHPQVVVATRMLRRGEPIGRGDVQLEISKSKRPNYGSFHDIESVLGMEARTTIAAGRPLLDQDLQRPILVRRNEEANLVVRAGNVRIATTVKVLANGALHDFVAVETIDEKQPFSARVTGSRQLEITVGGPPKARAIGPKLSRRDRYTRQRQQTGQLPSAAAASNVSFQGPAK